MAYATPNYSLLLHYYYSFAQFIKTLIYLSRYSSYTDSPINYTFTSIYNLYNDTFYLPVLQGSIYIYKSTEYPQQPLYQDTLLYFDNFAPFNLDTFPPIIFFKVPISFFLHFPQTYPITYSFISIIVAISNPSQFVPIQKLSKILPSRITISSFRVNNSPSLNCLFTTTSELLPFLHLLLLFIFFLLFSFKFSGIFVSHSSFALFQLSYYP